MENETADHRPVVAEFFYFSTFSAYERHILNTLYAEAVMIIIEI